MLPATSLPASHLSLRTDLPLADAVTGNGRKYSILSELGFSFNVLQRCGLLQISVENQCHNCT